MSNPFAWSPGPTEVKDKVRKKKKDKQERRPGRIYDRNGRLVSWERDDPDALLRACHPNNDL